MINPSHNLPVNQPFVSGEAGRTAAVSPTAGAAPEGGERRSAPREQITRQVPGERVLDGELQDELLREAAGAAARRGSTLEGATWRATNAIDSYEAVRSANPAYASTSGLLLDTYA